MNSKKTLLVTSSLALFGSTSVAMAEESNIGFSFKSGDLSIKRVASLSFGEVEYSSTAQNVNLYVKDFNPSVSYFYRQNNETSRIAPPLLPEDFPKTSTIDIQDDRIENQGWRLTARMSDFKNDQAGNSLTGFALSMKNSEDLMVENAISDPNINLNDIVLQSGGLDVPVAEYRGDAGNGRHGINYFGNMEREAGNTSATPVKVNDISLFIPGGLKVEAGQYQAAITWSLANSL